MRVVSIGKSVEDLLANPADPENAKYSVEFCGGTHLKSTGQARAFALLSEEGIAKVGPRFSNIAFKIRPMYPQLEVIGLIKA